MSFIARLVADESAQDLAEYGIALAVIAVAIAGDVGNLWSSAQAAIHAAV